MESEKITESRKNPESKKRCRLEIYAVESLNFRFDLAGLRVFRGMVKKVKSSDNGQLNQDKVEFTDGIGKNYGIHEKLGVKNSKNSLSARILHG